MSDTDMDCSLVVRRNGAAMAPTNVPPSATSSDASAQRWQMTPRDIRTGCDPSSPENVETPRESQ